MKERFEMHIEKSKRDEHHTMSKSCLNVGLLLLIIIVAAAIWNGNDGGLASGPANAVGDVFGTIFGFIGGIFGAVFGLVGGIIGGVFGLIGQIFGLVFG